MEDDVILIYRTRKGEDILVLEPDVTKIDLSYQHILSIDLTPLSKCRDLVSLDLSNNQISGIDLWPLARCKKLRRLSLLENPLTQVDVTPLFACPMLATVEVDPTVEIEADSELGRTGRRPRPLHELRKQRVVKWNSDKEFDPLKVIEKVKNEVYVKLAETYPSPDNAQLVDETLKFNICEEVEKILLEKVKQAEKEGDFKKVFILERSLDYLKTNAP